MTITSQQVDAWDAEVDAAYASGVAAGAAREKRPWVGLTREEMVEAVRPLCSADDMAKWLVEVSEDEYKAIEAVLKEKNFD